MRPSLALSLSPPKVDADNYEEAKYGGNYGPVEGPRIVCLGPAQPPRKDERVGPGRSEVRPGSEELRPFSAHLCVDPSPRPSRFPLVLEVATSAPPHTRAHAHWVDLLCQRIALGRARALASTRSRAIVLFPPTLLWSNLCPANAGPPPPPSFSQARVVLVPPCLRHTVRSAEDLETAPHLVLEVTEPPIP